MQMVVLDGNAYDAKCLEMGAERDDDLDSCALVLNNKQAPLLAAGPSATHDDQHRVVVQLVVSACYKSCTVCYSTPMLIRHDGLALGSRVDQDVTLTFSYCV